MNVTAPIAAAAFKLAHQRAKAAGSPALARRVRAAGVAWADDDRLNGMSVLSGAMAVAEAHGVGAPFLDSIGDAAADAALQTEMNRAAAERSIAQVKLAQGAYASSPPTDDKGYVDWVLAQVKAAPENSAEILAAAYKYSPSAQAYEAAKSASSVIVEAFERASAATQEAIKAGYKNATDLIKHGQELTVGLLLGIVALSGVTLYAISKY